jgi:zinc protease
MGILLLLQFEAQSQNSPSKDPLPLDPLIRTGVLPNGLTYFIRHNEKPDNRVALRMAVKTGSTMEDDNQQGLAHLIEHMAFNGTKHFAKQDLVSYLEKTGTKFGPHLNAYTSFDETVYMLQVPTDDPEILSNGLLILEDWASGLSFEPKEIDAERGVVVEEWRTRLGAGERMRNQYWPVLFKDSRYGERLPIGKTDVIKNAPYERLTTFYKEFYRPNNMAIMIIGDIDVDAMEAEIKKRFTPLVNPPKYRENIPFEVPDHSDFRIATAVDKEATWTNVELIYKLPTTVIRTREDYRYYLMTQLFNGMINARFNELAHSSNPPFAQAGAYYSSWVATKNAFSSSAYVVDSGIETGLRALITENNRVKLHGFLASELDRQKQEILAYYENDYREREKQESSRYAFELVDHFLRGNAVPGINLELEMCKDMLSGISITELNQLAKQWISQDGSNCTLIIEAPDKPDLDIPTDPEIRAMFDNPEIKNPKPYVDAVNTTPFFNKQLTKGSVVKKTPQKDYDYATWTLSNGIEVNWKKTDFKADQITVYAMSKGGTGMVNDENFDHLDAASKIVGVTGLGSYSYPELGKYTTGKIVSLYPAVSENLETIFGSSSVNDFELLMQMIHHTMSGVPVESDAYTSFKNSQESFWKNRALDPNGQFRDTINYYLTGNHPRKRPLNMDRVNRVNHQKSIALFNERFRDADDFKFFIIGNVDEAKLESYCTTYLATLPSLPASEDFHPQDIQPATTPYSKTVYAGKEDKANVQLTYSGPAAFSISESMMLDALQKLASIKLRESLREENSGTYGVNCYGYLKRQPAKGYESTISWQCAPSNVELLMNAASKVIAKIKSEGCTADEITKVKETLRRDREVNLKENNYWRGQLVNKAFYGDDILSDAEFDRILSMLSAEKMKSLASTYYSDKALASFILLPETSKK